MNQFFTYNLHNRIAVYCILVVALVLFGCRSGERQTDEASDPEIPERIDTLQNLTVYSPENQSLDTVELVRDQTYGDTEEIFIGWIRSIAVDNKDRVYIAEGKRGRSAIYVYTPDGSYLTTIGRDGRGPGEFRDIQSMEILNDYLYVYDVQRKISVFSTDDFTHVHDKLLRRDNVKDDEELLRLGPKGDLSVREDGSFLMNFESRILSNTNRQFLYYELSGDGYILPGKILEFKRYRFYMPDKKRVSGGILMALPMPFSRSSLTAVSPKGPIFTAWTDDFLIKVHDKKGMYQRAFYYPYENSPLQVSDLDFDEGRERLLDNNEVPETWPALHTMFLDDEDRLWVATITESAENYLWWILNEKGELLGKFTFPGEKRSRSVTSQPDNQIVKNGYLYNKEVDEETGQYRVVRYRIEMK